MRPVLVLFYPLAGSKAAPVGMGSKPAGIGSAATAGQAPAEGGNVLLGNILGGGAAEQAGKLGDGRTA